MVWGAVLGLGASLLGGRNKKKAAANAAGAQIEQSQLSIDEQQRQFDALTELLSPYSDSGEQALGAQKDLLGLGDPNAQQRAIDAIQQGPEFTSLVQQGEDAILANASATGGLRGGNTQGALAEYRPQILSSLLQQRFAQLGGLVQGGQQAASFQGAAGMDMANQIGAQRELIGKAQAGNSLARGKANQGILSTATKFLGSKL